MINDIKKENLPSCLQTREGWADLFTLKRTKEPHIHQIEPTNYCPYSCIMCPRSKYMTRPQGFMELFLYRKIIDEIAFYPLEIRRKEIELFHFGESLLHPEIVSMIDYAVKKNLKIVLSVNAPELTPSLAEKILSKNPYKIIISLDGYDQLSYQLIRGNNADYAKAKQNIHSLLKFKTNDAACTTLVILRIIRINMNENYCTDFKKFWENEGAIVEIRDFFPWNKAELTDLGAVKKYPPFMPCPFPWQYLAVQWNGDVVPCCRDYNAINRLGNVTEKSLKTIWNSPEAELFRKQMATGKQLKDICRECLEIYYTDSLCT